VAVESRAPSGGCCSAVGRIDVGEPPLQVGEPQRRGRSRTARASLSFSSEAATSPSSSSSLVPRRSPFSFPCADLRPPVAKQEQQQRGAEEARRQCRAEEALVSPGASPSSPEGELQAASRAARSSSSFHHGGPPLAQRAAHVAAAAATSCGDGDDSVVRRRWRRRLLVLWLVALRRQMNDSGVPTPASPLSPSWSVRGQTVSRGPRATSPMKEPHNSYGSRRIQRARHFAVLLQGCRCRGKNGKRLLQEAMAKFGRPRAGGLIPFSPLCGSPVRSLGRSSPGSGEGHGRAQLSRLEAWSLELPAGGTTPRRSSSSWIAAQLSPGRSSTGQQRDPMEEIGLAASAGGAAIQRSSACGPGQWRALCLAASRVSPLPPQPPWPHNRPHAREEV
jgi:hypothetical protein